MLSLFEYEKNNQENNNQLPKCIESITIDDRFLRKDKIKLPALSELQVVRHFTQLSKRNFSIETNFYPLGSCTMKYNPKVAHSVASLEGFSQRHPFAPLSYSQGYLTCAYELQEMLKSITGMSGISLACMAGAQGEFAGVAMIKAYHKSRNDNKRTEIIVPDAAHGTNPASAVMCGYTVRELPTLQSGDIDLGALTEMVSEKTAGIMLTNPSTLGVFERQIEKVAQIVHAAGGLLYYDGANLNAIMGKVRPGDMGFDVLHLNLHKTFATPHGGGGPGAGPVACSEKLKPFLPVPIIEKDDEKYFFQNYTECPQTIGQLCTFAGNAGIILRAFAYIKLLGKEGIQRVTEFASLNANYLMQKLANAGFEVAFPTRYASHEFIITFKKIAKEYQVTAMDIAKRLLDYGFHAPTTYFPLLVPECFLIEPTETESKQTIDAFVDALISIVKEIETDSELVKNAPHTLPVKRLDDVLAARNLDIAFNLIDLY